MRALLTRIALAASAAALCAGAAFAQEAAPWLRSAPEGEGFAARMPKEPTSAPERAEAGELKAEGRRYEAADGEGRRYVVWSLKDPANVGERFARASYVSEVFRGEALYLDMIAEVAWALLVAPLNEKARAEGKLSEQGHLTYAREFRLNGKPAREYALYSRKVRGPVFVCFDGPRLYVVAALGADAQDPRLRQFVESFTLNPDAPARVPLGDPVTGTGTRTGIGMGPGRGGGPGVTPGGGGAATAGDHVYYNRTFRQAEVTQKAVITFKPEPGFTEEARKFLVTGTVRLVAVLNKTGEVTGVSILKGLPHGLTLLAVRAAGKIKFRPAQKDGQPVSQYVVLEYKYNIY